MQNTSKAPRTEQEWADFYQAHKDDPEVWGEEVPPPRKQRGRPSKGMAGRISVRFTPEEMHDIKARAHKEGIFLSDVVRRAVAAYVGKTE
jgi:hypothetical protein